MECPICKKSKHIEIDTHSDGFAQNLQECGDCGALWTRKAGNTIIIHGATKRAA
jgi:DNA polymerase III alpha subunit (gram-positive type)